jgi:hypothetical protein
MVLASPAHITSPYHQAKATTITHLVNVSTEAVVDPALLASTNPDMATH